MSTKNFIHIVTNAGESKFHFIVFPSESPIFPKLHRGATEKSREQVDAREQLHNDDK